MKKPVVCIGNCQSQSGFRMNDSFIVKIVEAYLILAATSGFRSMTCGLILDQWHIGIYH
jgi:hypothetical protein